MVGSSSPVSSSMVCASAIVRDPYRVRSSQLSRPPTGPEAGQLGAHDQGGARLALDLLPAPGQVVEMLALVANRGVHRRDLGDLADELAERGPHLLSVQPSGVAARDDGALGVEGLGALAEPDGAAVGLGLAVEVVDEPGGASQADGEQALGHGVEGAGVADPPLTVDPADLPDAVEGGLPHLLVEGQDGADRAPTRRGRGGGFHG